MKRLFPILILFCALRVVGASAFNQITLTFTSIPTNGCTVTVGSSTYLWTNAPINQTTWLQTNGIAGSATNLTRRVGALQPQWFTKQTNSTNVIISGAGLGVSIVGNYGFLTTNSLANNTNRILLDLPFDYMFETNRTNAADALVYGIGKYALTSAFPANASALTANFVGITNQQTLTRKTLTGPFINNGTNDGTVLTNIPRAAINLLLATNGTLLSGTVSNAVVTNAISISGTLGPLTNGILQYTKLTNVTVHATNLNAFNAKLDKPILTNALGSISNILLINWGAGGVGEKIIITNAPGSPLANIAFDNGDVENGLSGFELDFGGTTYWQFIGSTNGLAIIGPSGLNLLELFDTVLYLGDSGVTIQPQSDIVGGTYTNQIFRGTNSFNSSISFVQKTNLTLANGYNDNVPLGGTNVFVRLSGPNAAYTNRGFVAGVPGEYHIVEFDNPARNMTLLEQDGGSSAANRITTGRGTINYTSNPVLLQFIYGDKTNAWHLMPSQY